MSRQKPKTKSAKNAKFQKVMKEFADGTLTTSAGKKVTSRRQAIAIAYSASGMHKSRYLATAILLRKSARS